MKGNLDSIPKENSLGPATTGAEDDVRIDTTLGARRSMARMDSTIQKLASHRADLGAIRNRFGPTVTNTDIQMENLSASKSRLKDADFALKTSELVPNQVLHQLAVSILSQADQSPQMALTLRG